MFEELIPAGLRSKLLQSSLSPSVISTVRALQTHYNLSGVPFFREYTDHSFQHSIDVFKAACDVLAENALEVISSDDLALLLLGCVLHDSGLHITEDIFLALTDQSNSTIANTSFDKESWPELWTDFVAEAERFSAKKLISLFGDNERVREPPRSSIDMTQRDRLLIGEFLRRHHPRYAHDFAVGKVPTATGERFKLDGLDPPIRDIAGLIARSHGLDLRLTFDYVQRQYDLRDYNRIHIIFLMVLLRVADYLQIQSARAPLLFAKLHNIRSPFSLGEWRLHQCIENVTTSSLDPEAILVAANPRSVHEYLRFDGWLKGLQRELDISWAILGEVVTLPR
jgi:molecular chaperone HtpG